MTPITKDASRPIGQSHTCHVQIRLESEDEKKGDFADRRAEPFAAAEWPREHGFSDFDGRSRVRRLPS
jgi:hypothetical protein